MEMAFQRGLAFVLWLAMCGIASLPAAAEPGRLLDAKPMDDAPSGARAWRIHYETTDVDGDPTQSSGVLVVPDGAAPPAGRDVVAWAHGTVGIDSSCTPIRTLDQIPGLTDMLARGWAVVATDYPGLGTRGPHAYLVGDAAAAAVLDSVRAARNFAGAHAGQRFVAWGHSQGAHAALFSGRRVLAYAPELQMLGIAAVSPPTHLAENMKQADVTVRAVLTAFTAESWSKVYGADISTIADRTTRGVIERATSACEGDRLSAAALLRVLRLRLRLGNLDLSGHAPWDALMARNSLDALDAASPPLLIVQSDGDKLVTSTVTRSFFERSCQRGVVARYVSLPDTGHAATAIASANDAIGWIAERFSGQPAPNDCPARI